MDRKSICSLLCAMMLAILLISCNDEDDYDGLSPAELSGTYSNKLSAPANGDSLILSYNGNTFIGKDVEFKTDDGKTALLILKYVLPHDTETAIPGISLTAGPAIIPATIYPKTTGCFNHLKTNVIIPAAINITARSEIRGAISDMLFIIMCLQIYILT